MSDDLEARLGYRFRDSSVLDRALTHRSHAYEAQAAPGAHYERLEFLGDSLLGFLAADWLVDADTEADEGTLTRKKQSVVNANTLAAAARRLDLGAALRMGRGEASSGGREKTSLLADAFEAVLGAIYVDGGLRAARAFVRRHLGGALRAADTAADAKTRLQEAIQGRTRRTPTYRIVSTSGPAHSLSFEAEALIEGEVVGVGTGTSRKDAEQDAARNALARLEAGS